MIPIRWNSILPGSGQVRDKSMLLLELGPRAMVPPTDLIINSCDLGLHASCARRHVCLLNSQKTSLYNKIHFTSGRIKLGVFLTCGLQQSFVRR